LKNKKHIEKKQDEKSYSYDEFVREFYPSQVKQTKRFEQSPREFGKTLAEDAVKTIREHLSHQ
jgi:hypothetical protein